MPSIALKVVFKAESYAVLRQDRPAGEVNDIFAQAEEVTAQMTLCGVTDDVAILLDGDECLAYMMPYAPLVDEILINLGESSSVMVMASTLAETLMEIAGITTGSRRIGGFPVNDGEVIIFEAIGKAFIPLSSIPGRWYYNRYQDFNDTCTWEDDAQPELTAMPPTNLNYGLPYNNAQNAQRLWTDFCPYDPTIVWPSSGQRDLQLDLQTNLSSAMTPSVSSVLGATGVNWHITQQTKATNESDSTTSTSDDLTTIGGSPATVSKVVEQTKQTLTTKDGDFDASFSLTASGSGTTEAAIRGSYSQGARMDLTDTTGQRGIAAFYTTTLHSPTYKTSYDANGGGNRILATAIEWEIEIILSLMGYCKKTNPGSYKQLAHYSHKAKHTHPAIVTLTLLKKTESRSASASSTIATGGTVTAQTGNQITSTSTTGGAGQGPGGTNTATKTTTNVGVIPGESSSSVITGNKTISGAASASHDYWVPEKITGFTFDSIGLDPHTARLLQPKQDLRLTKVGTRLEFGISNSDIPTLLWDDPFNLKYLVPSSGLVVTPL